jgi:hypothetical protein
MNCLERRLLKEKIRYSGFTEGTNILNEMIKLHSKDFYPFEMKILAKVDIRIHLIREVNKLKRNERIKGRNI